MPTSKVNADAQKEKWAKAFGQLVYEARTRRGMKLEDLSERTGSDTGTLSRITNGRASVTWPVAFRICHALEIRPGDVFASLGLDVDRFRPLDTPREVLDDDESLIYDDVLAFLDLYDRNHGAATSLLAALLDEAAYQATTTPYQAATGLDGPQDRKRGLRADDLDSLLEGAAYRIEVRYPTKLNERVITGTYWDGGIISWRDAEFYIRRVHGSYIDQLDRQLESVVSRIAAGALERIKLVDLILLNETLGRRLGTFGICWSAFEFLSELRTSRDSIPQSDNVQEEDADHRLRLATVFVTIFRWIQYSDWDEADWLRRVRAHLHAR